MKKSIIILTAFFSILLLCKKEPTKPPPPGEPVDFEKYIQPIFNQSCAITNCHTGTNPTGNLDLSEGNSKGNLIDVISPNYNAYRVRSGKPDSSVLYNKISDSGKYGGVMPPTGKLPQSEIDLIKRWIEELPDSVENLSTF
jgi:hypothetical protein